VSAGTASVTHSEPDMTEGAGIAVVTGASSGIGAVYAGRLAGRGYDLVLVSRSAPPLRKLAMQLRADTGRKVSVIFADLTNPIDLDSTARAIAALPSLSVLVNSAGIGATATLLDSDMEAMQDLLLLNTGALVRLTHAAAASMVARGKGTIVNISSSSALAPELINGVYAGSKAFVLAFSQSLQHELGPRGVFVQAVLPGATATPFWKTAGKSLEHLPKHTLMSAEDLVDAALRGLDQGELVTIPSLPDISEWKAFEAAREHMRPHLSSALPAQHYAPER